MWFPDVTGKHTISCNSQYTINKKWTQANKIRPFPGWTW